MKRTRPGNSSFEIGDAGLDIAVIADVDAMPDKIGIGGQTQQRAVAGVDADLQHATLEPRARHKLRRAGASVVVRRPGRRIGLAIPIEQAALEDLAGVLD